MRIDGTFLRYVGRMFTIRLVFFLIFFIVILQMLDLLNQSDNITAGPADDWKELLQYVSLRAPQIASQFTPFAGLLAIVVTLASLNLTSEITIMRAAGMSINRVLYPIGIVCVAIAFLHFAFHEMVVVKATEKLDYWEANDYSNNIDLNAETRTSINLVGDNQIVRIGSASRSGARIDLKDLTIMSLDERGLAQSLVEAESATWIEGEWEMQQVKTLTETTVTAQTIGRLPWQPQFDQELIFAVSNKPDQTSLPNLINQIRTLGADGVDIRAETTGLLSRFSKPMSILIMPLLGAIAGFGVSRQGGQLTRAITGATLGFGYFVIENLMLALGKLGTVPAVFGAFFPFAFFLVIGFTILLSMDN